MPGCDARHVSTPPMQTMLIMIPSGSRVAAKDARRVGKKTPTVLAPELYGENGGAFPDSSGCFPGAEV